MPYALLSDQHCHLWSQYATTNADGVNSRLRIILNEMERAAAALVAAGGEVMVFAGDLFHVRGSIDPEVFNPTVETIKRILESGILIKAIPGNHDLKGKETTEIGNAMQQLGLLPGFEVVAHDNLIAPGLAMIPWCPSVPELRKRIEYMSTAFGNIRNTDLIIHAPVNGVLNIPDHGLDPVELTKYGFRRVFSGHYHAFKEFEGGKVVSIGATTHQTWSDIGTKAGFLLVYPDRISYQASHAPSFVEITGETEEDEIPLIVDGNYVRIRSMKLADSEINKFRRSLLDMGAKGVTFQIARETVSARSSTPRKTETLEQSVETFVDTIPGVDDVAALKKNCADVLATVKALAA